MNKRNCKCKCVLTSSQEDFEDKVSNLLSDGYYIMTARYECYISNFIWYAVLIKEEYDDSTGLAGF